MIRRSTIAIAAAMLVLAVGACSNNDDPAPEENLAETVPPLDQRPETVPDAPVVQATPAAAVEANMMAEAPPEVAPAPDERMMDDASATGMTARANRSDPKADEPRADEQIEPK